MKIDHDWQIFEKCSNIKFYDNPSSRSRVVETDRQTNIPKLVAAFRNFAKAPKKEKF